LRFEPGQAARVERKEVRQDLQGHVAVQSRVKHAIDLAHAACAQRCDDFVGTERLPTIEVTRFADYIVRLLPFGGASKREQIARFHENLLAG
jgi:hypothetical protein